MVTFENQILIDGLISMSNSFVTPSKEETQVSTHRLILTDFKHDEFFININNQIYSSKKGGFLETEGEIYQYMDDHLKRAFGHKGLELVHSDKITRSVNVITADYIDKLIEGKEKLGNMLLNYHWVWYMTKAGGNPNGVEKHNDTFGTFSKSEVDIIKHSYIPISPSPQELKPIRELVDLVVESSGLMPYVETTNAYDVRGKEVSGSRMYWLPRLIAREYLGEETNYGVTTVKLFNQMVTNAGLLDKPAIEANSDFLKSLTQQDLAEVDKKRFLMREHEARMEQLKASSSSSERIEKLVSISSDIRAQDKVVKTNEPIVLGY